MTTEASKHPVDDLLDDIEVRIEALEKIFKEDLNEGVARALTPRGDNGIRG